MEPTETAPRTHLPLAELTADVARACLDRLADPAALADETVVHENRVATKRLRAAWRLVADHAGRSVARARRTALTELSGKLSGARDLTVLTRLAQHLAAAQTDGRLAMALDHVVAALIQRHDLAIQAARSDDALLHEIREAWTAEIAAWEALDPAHPHALRRAIRHELRRSLHRARRDTRQAARSLDAELWHDWRKTVKRLRYQREFIAASQGRAPGKFDARIHRLGSRLGERNDLANLIAFADRLLADGALTPADYNATRQAIAAAETAIIRHCRRLGRATLLR